MAAGGQRLWGVCHAARLSWALITLSSSAVNKGSLSSLIPPPPPEGPLLSITAAWHAGGHLG